MNLISLSFHAGSEFVHTWHSTLASRQCRTCSASTRESIQAREHEVEQQCCDQSIALMITHLFFLDRKMCVQAVAPTPMPVRNHTMGTVTNCWPGIVIFRIWICVVLVWSSNNLSYHHQRFVRGRVKHDGKSSTIDRLHDTPSCNVSAAYIVCCNNILAWSSSNTVDHARVPSQGRGVKEGRHQLRSVAALHLRTCMHAGTVPIPAGPQGFHYGHTKGSSLHIITYIYYLQHLLACMQAATPT